jgi:dihydroneopterin aldolase
MATRVPIAVARSPVVRPDVWRANFAEQAADTISVRNLQILLSAGVDAWGRKKQQPVLVTVTLHLEQPFDSAAQADALDSSTVHYGKLSKAILERLRSSGSHVTTAELTDQIATTSTDMAKDALMAQTTEVFYPKGSMLGDGAGWYMSLFHSKDIVSSVSMVLHLRNVRVPCLIGVNANERLQKQPLIINLWVECARVHMCDQYPALEAVLVKVKRSFSYVNSSTP